MSIQNYLNQIKSAVFGKDVRQSIHDAIKQCYDDASIDHDNANMEVKLARGSHHTLNERFTSVEENIKNNSEQLEIIENNINNYENYVIDIGKDTEDWQPAIEKALADKNTVTLNNQVYKIGRTIKLNSNQSIYGKDKNKCIIKLNNNSNCEMIKLNTNTVRNITIKEISLDGNRANQTTNSTVLEIKNAFNIEFDPLHNIHNINIIESSGNGFVFVGRSASSISNIDVQRVNGDGIVANCYDSTFINCSVGHAKDGTAIIVDGANNRFTNCKGWGSLNGVHVRGSRCGFSILESQDNGTFGVKVDGSMNILIGTFCDSIGYRYKAGQGIFEPNATSIIVSGYDNIITGLCVDRAEFSKVGSQHYALECTGMRNKINLLAKDLLTDAINGTPHKTNQIEFISALNKENTGNVSNRFCNEVNGIVDGNGFIISGSDSTSVIMPVINNEKLWTKGLEYNATKDCYQIGTHLIPKGWSLDLGQPTNKWKSVWIREYLNIRNDENTADLSIGENCILNKKASLFIRGGQSTNGIIIDSDSNTLRGHSSGTWDLGNEDYIYNSVYVRDIKIKSPDNSVWTLTVNNDGTIKTSKV